MKRNIIIFVTVLSIELLVCAILYFFVLKIPQKLEGGGFSLNVFSRGAESAAGDESDQDWVPFAVDETYGSSPLTGFKLNRKEVQSAESRNAAASASAPEKLMESIRMKMPHFPYDKLPLLKPGMLISASERPFNGNISMNTMLYTEATYQDTLAFYRDSLKKYVEYKEEKYEDSSTGENYTISVSIPGQYKTNASVMIMEMPEKTGYTCALNITASIIGAAEEKKEEAEVGYRADGFPANYPDNLLPVFKLKEVFEGSGDSEGCWVQYYSSGSYQEGVKFFRDRLNDKSDFEESTSEEEGTRFRCLVPGWDITIQVADNGDGTSFINAEFYVN